MMTAINQANNNADNATLYQSDEQWFIEIPGKPNTTVYPIEQFPFCVGRALDNDLVLSDPTVSPHHFVIEKNDANELIIHNLSDENGTKIHGKKITRHTVENKHVKMSLGRLKIALRSEDEVLSPTLVTQAKGLGRLFTHPFAIPLWVMIVLALVGYNNYVSQFYEEELSFAGLFNSYFWIPLLLFVFFNSLFYGATQYYYFVLSVTTSAACIIAYYLMNNAVDWSFYLFSLATSDLLKVLLLLAFFSFLFFWIYQRLLLLSRRKTVIFTLLTVFPFAIVVVYLGLKQIDRLRTESHYLGEYNGSLYSFTPFQNYQSIDELFSEAELFFQEDIIYAKDDPTLLLAAVEPKQQLTPSDKQQPISEAETTEKPAQTPTQPNTDTTSEVVVDKTAEIEKVVEVEKTVEVKPAKTEVIPTDTPETTGQVIEVGADDDIELLAAQALEREIEQQTSQQQTEQENQRANKQDIEREQAIAAFRPQLVSGEDILAGEETPTTSDTRTAKIDNKPPKLISKKPYMALIFDDVATRQHVNGINALGLTTTMSFLPPTEMNPDSAKIAETFPEYMVHLPLEATNFNKTEQNTLYVGDSKATIYARVAEVKQQFPRVKLINNHTGSRFTEDAESTRVLLQALEHNHIGFLDSRTTAATTAGMEAESLGQTIYERDVFLDNDDNPDEILKELKRGIAVAKKDGHAIVIGHPRPNTLKVLKENSYLLNEVELVMMSEFIRRIDND